MWLMLVVVMLVPISHSSRDLVLLTSCPEVGSTTNDCCRQVCDMTCSNGTVCTFTTTQCLCMPDVECPVTGDADGLCCSLVCGINCQQDETCRIGGSGCTCIPPNGLVGEPGSCPETSEDADLKCCEERCSLACSNGDKCTLQGTDSCECVSSIDWATIIVVPVFVAVAMFLCCKYVKPRKKQSLEAVVPQNVAVK